MFSKWLLLLFSVSILPHRVRCYECQQVIKVDGRLWSPARRGVFVSENFPHSLPVRSNCFYEFNVIRSYSTDVICFRFAEFKLFTVGEYSTRETAVDFKLGSSLNSATILVYSGDGSLYSQINRAELFVHTWPKNLLDGPVCMRIHNIYNIVINVRNFRFEEYKLGRMTRFYAEYEATDSGTVQNNTSSTTGLHRCLDNRYVDESKRCNFKVDCGSDSSQLYFSDYFAGYSSDESYEHARCNTSRSFGTNFALGQASAQRIETSQSRLDCYNDHSRHFSEGDTRDCSLRLTMGNSPPLYHWLFGIRLPASQRSATCYRLFWFSRGFTDDKEALTLSEPNGGRVLLRIPVRLKSDAWSIAEFQLEAGFTNTYISIHAFLTKQASQSAGVHWLDDLSAEASACNQSSYESRMPSVCSFEWSTCGWEATNLSVVTDSSVAKEFGLDIRDHTSILVPDRKVPPSPQRLLRLRPGNSFIGKLESKRRLPYGNNWCIEIWFRGVGYNGYSVNLEALVSGIDPGQFILLKIRRPMNEWHRLSGYVALNSKKSPVVTVTLSAGASNYLNAVLLDDFSMLAGSCMDRTNGTVQCGVYEWKCYNGLQCIPARNRCDGLIHCDDASDETNCSESSGSAGSIFLRIVIGISVSVVAFLSLAVCFHKRRTCCNRRPGSHVLVEQSQTPATVSDGRLPGGLRSDRPRRTADMPPSYEEVATSAYNSGFSADEEPPKYEEIMLGLQTSEQQPGVTTAANTS